MCVVCDTVNKEFSKVGVITEVDGDTVKCLTRHFSEFNLAPHDNTADETLPEPTAIVTGDDGGKWAI